MKRMTRSKATKRVWRVVCILGDGHVFGDCGHDHETSTEARCCSYAPRTYQLDREAKLFARPRRRDDAAPARS